MKRHLLLLSACIFFLNPLTAQNWGGIGVSFDSIQLPTYYCLYGDSVGNKLYIGERNIYSNGVHYSGIITWDGAEISGLGDSITSLHQGSIYSYGARVFEITRYKDEIYAGGFFLLAGYDTVNSIARWDGLDWKSVGKGVVLSTTGEPAAVRCLYEMEDTLYIGGSFDSIAGSNIECDGLAKWDGTNWCNIEKIPTDDNLISINEMAEYKGELYVAGNFGGWTDTLNEIARWNGNQWLSVGGGIKGDAWVDGLAVYKGYLYVGGFFYEQDGNAGSFIMRWDGEQWSDVGGGVSGNNPYANGQIHELHVFNGKLWAGGVFDYAGGVPAKYLAKWDGSKWCGMEDRFKDRIYNLSSWGDSLYVLATIEEDSVYYVAQWLGGDYVDTCSTPINELVEIENTN
ncbi:MAG: hypothetical protein K9H64_22115, partial [Bacteroidales bacterium]|nr:hypothetical protein [Bacteroidales bacterium]MCF8458755.1 hypothetical protein [Bacteroidales bacterium]